MNIISIDLGTSLSKIVECNKELKLINNMTLYEKNVQKVLNEFIHKNNIDLKNVEKIILTGVGCSRVKEKEIKGIPVVKIDEFLAIASRRNRIREKRRGSCSKYGDRDYFC